MAMSMSQIGKNRWLGRWLVAPIGIIIDLLFEG